MKLVDMLAEATVTSTETDVDRLLAMVEIAPELSAAALALQRRLPLALPVVETRRLKEVANDLGFVMMPFAALSPAAWAAEPDQMKRAIHGFARLVQARGLESFALSDPRYFDMEAYLSLPSPPPMYGGGSASYYGGMHILAGPLGRRLSVLEATVTAAHTNICNLAAHTAVGLDGLLQAVQAVNLRVDRLAERKEAMRLEALGRWSPVTAATAAEHRWFRRYDPLLVALDGGVQSTHALVGPCWGPDIRADDVVAR